MTTRLRPQKIYTSREMILKDIDRADRKHFRLLVQSEHESGLAALNRDNVVEYERHREKAQRCKEKGERLKNTRMQKLKNALAEFDTMSLGLDGVKGSQVTLRPLEERR